MDDDPFPGGETEQPEAARPLSFASAVFLAWDIIHAGYQVEALSCRDDGGRVDWYILFLGNWWDSRVYKVRSRGEWEAWLGQHQQDRH